MRNYYDILGITPSASLDEIKQAYRKLSLKLHPDQNESDTFFNEIFKNINEAYSVLGNNIKRLQYDNTLQSNLNQGSKKQTHTNFDPLILDAISIILITNQASASILQRKLLIGYSPANLMIDKLNELGIIGKFNNDLPRKILVNKQQAVNLLVQKISNFSKVEFLEKYDYYLNLNLNNFTTNNVNFTKQQTTPINKTSFISIWDGVKKLRRVKNGMWIINLCLVLYIILVKQNYYNLPTFYNNHQSGSINANSGLNLRTEPNSTSTIITSIPYKSEVDIINVDGPNEKISEKSANWFKIIYQGKTGWIWGGYIDKD